MPVSPLAFSGRATGLSQTRGWVGNLCVQGGWVYHGRMSLVDHTRSYTTEASKDRYGRIATERDRSPHCRGRGAGYPAPPRTDPGVRY